MKLALWLWFRRWQLLSSILPIIIAVFAIFVGIPSSDRDAFIYGKYGAACLLLAIFTVLSIIMSLRETETSEDLKEKRNVLIDKLKVCQDDFTRAEEDHRDLFENVLHNMAKNLAFDNKERISVYEKIGGCFVLIGRYSQSPDFRENGRLHYPINQGILGKAWEHGEAHVDDLPDPMINEGRDYCAMVHQRYAIPTDIVENFRMKARSLYGKAVLDADEENQVAVIIFESTRPEKCSPSLMKGVFDKQHSVLKHYLAQRRGLSSRPKYEENHGRTA